MRRNPVKTLFQQQASDEIILDLIAKREHQKIKCLDIYNNSYLHYAAQYGRISLLKTLLQNPNFDMNGQTIAGYTPLYLACSKGHLESAVLLLEKGAKLSTRCGEDGLTALHIACANGHYKIVEMLLKQDFSCSFPFLSTKNRQSAYAIAMQNQHLDIAKLVETKEDQVKENAPDYFKCPISLDWMGTAAVLFPSGNTYDLKHARLFMGKKDPLTRQKVNFLVTNTALNFARYRYLLGGFPEHTPETTPDYLLDPVTQTILIEPTIASTGVTYSKASLDEIMKGNQLCVVTDERIKSFAPNRALNELLEDYKAKKVIEKKKLSVKDTESSSISFSLSSSLFSEINNDKPFSHSSSERPAGVGTNSSF